MHMIRASIYLVALLYSACCVTAMELPNDEFSKPEEECTRLKNQEIDDLKSKIDILSGDGSDGDAQSQDRHFEEILKTLPLPTNTSQSSQGNPPIIAQEPIDKSLSPLPSSDLGLANYSFEQVIGFFKAADSRDTGVFKAAQDRLAVLLSDPEQCKVFNREFESIENLLNSLSPQLQRNIAAYLRFQTPQKLSLLKTINPSKYYVKRLIFNNRGTMLATLASDKKARVWDHASGKLLYTLDDDVSHIAFNPQDTLIATVGYDHKICKLWDADTGKYRQIGLSAKNTLNMVAFNHQGTLLAGACEHEHVYYKDPYDLVGDTTILCPYVLCPYTEFTKLSKDTPAREKDPQWKDATCVAFSPNDSILAVGADGHINLWDLARGKLLRTIKDKNELHPPSKKIVFDQEGTTLVSDGGFFVCFWDSETGELKGRVYRATFIGFDLYSNVVASGAGTYLELCNSKTCKQVQHLDRFNDLLHVCFNKSGTIIAASDIDGIHLYQYGDEKIPLSAIIAHIVSKNLPANTLRTNKLERASELLIK